MRDMFQTMRRSPAPRLFLGLAPTVISLEVKTDTEVTFNHLFNILTSHMSAEENHYTRSKLKYLALACVCVCLYEVQWNANAKLIGLPNGSKGKIRNNTF